LFHYGDWCAPDMGYKDWMKRGKWTGTACLAHSSGIVSEIAGILGETEEAEEYKKLSQETAQAYRNILMDENCHIKGGDFQTAFVLPLYYNMLSGNDKKTTAANLVNLIRDNNYNIKTGFPGTPYVLFALADNGYLEDAYKMLLTDTCPSWLYEVKAGATTMWERWDALREDGSCNLGEDNGKRWNGSPSTIMQMVQWGISFTDVFWELKPQREDIRHFALHRSLAVAFPGL